MKTFKYIQKSFTITEQEFAQLARFACLTNQHISAIIRQSLRDVGITSEPEGQSKKKSYQKKIK